ncbi:MAG: FAD-dependent oxidoreductase [Clostridiales bacterium]|nr:FAD-dependent oxidoreductase [Clostridiales bacterium]
MKLSDFKGLFRRSALTLLKVENPFDDYYRITLKPGKDTVWHPGDHGVFTLPGRKVKGRSWRAFSVASIPQENTILIGTRTGENISGFKKELTSMQEGDLVNVIGPFGWFKIQDDTSPIVLVAGGVGITPIRALLKQLENDTARPIELVFQAKGHYLFGDELLNMAIDNPKITVQMTRSKEDSQKALDAIMAQHGNKAYYYISGPRPFVKANKKHIKQHSIPGSKIISDPFLGY